MWLLDSVCVCSGSQPQCCGHIQVARKVDSHLEPGDHAPWAHSPPPHPSYILTDAPSQWQMKRVLLARLTPWGWRCLLFTASEKGWGGGLEGSVCVCVCAWVRAQWEEENHNSVLWFSWHILSITLSVTWLMGTTESRVNEWPSSHVNPLFQSLSFHEFSAFILPMWWGCYWDRRWVSRKLRGAFLECSTFPQWGILNRRVIMKQVK